MERLLVKQVNGLPTLALLGTGLLLCLPSATALGAPEAEFAVKATNGYEISVEGIGAQVTMTVKGRGATATYTVQGRVSPRRLKGRFGNLGRIAMRFQARGKPKRIAPPEGCQGPKRNLSEGVFVGSFRFKGERGYTQLQKKRVPGSVSTGRRWRCGSLEGSGPAAGPGGGLDRLPFWGRIHVLGAFDPKERSVFAAVGFKEVDEIDDTIFLAGTTERHGSMRIGRSALAFARARAFAAAPGLTGATVRPPRPFRGTAVFVRNADGATSWDGPLTVSLPGAEAVPLTGPGFTTDLVRPKSVAEFAALLGRPGL
ncbi:MAG TPA: hypothetical protein VNP96_06815 [Solirubrobacterales bacterium]|nr:hypothetical protein [Solirubrobacterales bacterium]